MNKEQILALAEEQGAVANLKQHFNMAGDSIVFTPEELEAFFNAAIKSYKAELLKEVGEPVLYAEFAEDGSWLSDASDYAYHLEEPHALFTSDQVAAAILKATKPLEERRCEICGYAEHHREHTGCLRTQLAAAQEEIANMCNCEWKDIETAPKETEIFIGRFIDGKFRFGRSELIYEHANEFAGETWSGWLWLIDDCNDSIADCPTHWMPLPKPPAIAQGEQ